jgi:hypothetical protein
MAPEMFASGNGPGATKALASSRGTDVYALGTLLWEASRLRGCAREYLRTRPCGMTTDAALRLPARPLRSAPLRSDCSVAFSAARPLAPCPARRS